jgi:hypothetical protein
MNEEFFFYTSENFPFCRVKNSSFHTPRALSGENTAAKN